MGPFRHRIYHLVKKLSPSGNSSGAVLLTVVFVLIIIGLAGAAIYSLTYTSTYTQMNAQNASRAQYMAESGFRTVVAQYNDADDANKNTALEDLHNETLTLPGNAGQFDVRVYPTWFYVVNGPYTAPVTSLQVKIPGGIPISDPENPGSAKLTIPGNGNSIKIRGKTQRAAIASSPTPSSPQDGDTVTFSLSGSGFLFDIENDEEVFLVFQDTAIDENQTLSLPNGTLNLPENNAISRFLPQKNGSFRIHNENNDKTDYTYSEKTTVGNEIQLTGITHQDPHDESELSVGIDDDTEIYLAKNLAIASSSSQGQGQFAGEKTVVAYSDVGLDGGFRIGNDTISFAEDIEDFDDPNLPMNNPTGATEDNKPIEVDTEDKEIRRGGGLQDGYGSVWYGGDSDVANCINGRCNLGRGFRVYFEFIADMDSSDNSKTHGDGFTFAISSGVWDGSEYRNTTDDTGGPLGEYMGYAGPGPSLAEGGDEEGIRPPKLALEIDTYPNTGSGDICGSDSRRDDIPKANHVAFDFWGAESDTATLGSLDTNGGYIRIGSATPTTGHPEDWSSPMGTISFWFKRDTIESTNDASTGDRMWGQSVNMEMRFTGNGGTLSDFVLDWGGSGTISATNPFTDENKWYFLAISWNETNEHLNIFWGDEGTQPALLINTVTWNQKVSTMTITENLFMNSSGGGGLRNFAVNGKGSDLRYYDIARDITQIQSDYDERLSGTETNLQAYFPLQSDFVNVVALGPSATAVPDTSWSDEVPSVFPVCTNIASRDDNRHGAGLSGSTTQPMNSLGGNDDYYAVEKTDTHNWLEDGKTYGVRMELIRPLDITGDKNYQIKAWIECLDASCTPLLSDVQKTHLRDTRSTYTDTEPKILRTLANGNPLVLDSSVHDNLNKILFGFTQGTGGATQDITITDMEIRFIKRYPLPVDDLDTW